MENVNINLLLFLVELSSWFLVTIIILKNRGKVSWAFFLLIFATMSGPLAYYYGEHIVFQFNIGWVFLIVFLIVERKVLSEYYLSKNDFSKNIFGGLVVGVILGTVFPIVWPSLSSPQQFSGWKLIGFLVHLFRISAVEELITRGFFLGKLLKYGKFPLWIANITQSLIFSVWHVDQGLEGFTASFIFGLFAGYLTWRNRNLAGAILAHTVLNFIT